MKSQISNLKFPEARLHFARQSARLTSDQAAELRTLGRLEGDYLYLPFAAYLAFRQKILAARSQIANQKSQIANSPPLPPLHTIAANAARALARNAVQAITGQPLFVTPEVESGRLAICQSPCEHYRAGDGRCSKCGCHTARLLRKTRLAAEHCPVGKW